MPSAFPMEALRLDTDKESTSQPSRLVERAKNGDREAFERLYRSHVGRVYAICLRILADPQRAEEVTQDVFVRAW